jgi:serine protease Do
MNRLGLLVYLSVSALLLGQDGKNPSTKTRNPDALHQLSTSLEALAMQVNRSVVKIVSIGYSLASDDDDSGNASVLSRQRSLGTGIVVRADGYIITNAHVVQGSRRVRVQLPSAEVASPSHHSVVRPNGKTVDAKVLGTDRDTDLAVLKVESKSLVPLPLGDSETLRPGQLVLAFGNPLGLQNSVSMGVVSSISRQIKPDDPMIYIQTDASINPGNSGGPLVDVDGRVMGVNTFILSQSGGSEGIGFAIPSNIVQTVFNQIREDGHVHRGQVGLRTQTLTPALAGGLGLDRDTGVLVADVTPGKSADEAGVKIGDLILNLDGKPMENARQFEVNIYGHRVDDEVELTVFRDGRELKLKVTVDEQEDDPQRFADLVDPEKNQIRRLGILGVEVGPKVIELLPDLRKPYGIVVAARTGATAAAADLQPGDVIHELNGAPITSIQAFREALEKLKPDTPLVLQVERDGKMSFVTVDLE